jgi:hypothetical protein
MGKLVLDLNMDRPRNLLLRKCLREYTYHFYILNEGWFGLEDSNLHLRCHIHYHLDHQRIHISLFVDYTLCAWLDILTMSHLADKLVLRHMGKLNFALAHNHNWRN